MIMVTVNGKDVPSEEGETLSSIIARCGFTKGRIAAEVNGEIIPRGEHETYRTSKDDRIEFVGLVGGG